MTAIQLQDVHGLHVSKETLRQRLRKEDLKHRIAARGPVLTVEHCRVWLNFSREHVDWVEADFVFSFVTGVLEYIDVR